MPTYEVYGTESLYYNSKEIEAEDEEEAKEKYINMIMEGEIGCDNSEIVEVNVHEINTEKQTTIGD